MIPLFYVLVTLLVIIVLSTRRSKRKLAPGPTIWPLIGNVVEIYLADPVYPHKAMAKLAEKYGKVMSLGFGSTYSVVVSGYEEMKDIFTRPESYEYRYELAFVPDRSFNKNLGIIWAHGDNWREMRRFTIRTLRDFGFGKKAAMELAIKQESDIVVEEIREIAMKNFGIWYVDPHYLGTFTLNVLWSMVGGFRFNHNDTVFKENLELNDRVSKILGQSNIYNAFPVLKKICPKLVEHDVHMQTHRDMQTWLRGLIEQTRQRRAERLHQEAESFVEVFLDEIDKNHGKPSGFNEEQLIVILLDLFLAGSETTSMTISWVILFLTLNSDCQQRLRSEILKLKAQRGSQMSIQDAGKLPYMNAILLEASRIGCVVPSASPRMAENDIKFADFVIPKGTALFPNVYPIYMDKEFWVDPSVFRPERFLDSSGEIIPKLAEQMTIFGFGKRECLGRTMAWDTLVLFTMMLFTNFTFEPIKGQEPSAESPVSSVTIRPRDYSVRVIVNRRFSLLN